MTAEVAVLNRSAIALAADSKVTVGPDGAGKTYDTVNKLFTVSKFHPVELMIYGNADFMGIPWETAIKLYRRNLGKNHRPTIEEYADEFIKSMTSSYTFSKERQENNVSILSGSIFSSIWKEVELEIVSRPSRVSDADVRRLIVAEVRSRLDALAPISPYAFPSVTDTQITNDFADVIRHEAIDSFSKYATPATTNLLVDLIIQTIAKRSFSPAMSGIVVAGFGEEQIYPAIVEYHVDGVFNGEIKAERNRSYVIDPLGPQSGVIPFAVKDMAYRFMEGIDGDYQRWLFNVVLNVFVQNSMSIVDRYVPAGPRKSRIRRRVRNASLRSLVGIFRSAEQFRKRNFVDPVLDMLDLLPKEELAILAESIVQITSLKQRASPEVESVGGPIDVAVISKGDGFIWIKRKHYFQPELNQGFIAKYFET